MLYISRLSNTTSVIAVATVLLFASTGQYAFGDSLQDNLSGAAQNVRLNPGGSQSVTYWISAQMACDFSAGNTVTVTPNGLPSGITASPTSLTFNACGSSVSNTQSISYQVSSVSPPLVGQYVITFSSTDPLQTNAADIEIYVKPPVPTLSSPADGGTTSDSTPDLTWNGVDASRFTTPPPFSYDVEVDDQSTFASPFPWGTGQSTTTFTVPSALPDGTYYWHVRTKQSDNVGDYSTPFSFIISSGPPPDLEEPTVIAISVNDPLITDSDAAADNFQVTIVFSETMNTSVAPTISFSANPGPTLSGPIGAWSTTTNTDDTYTATFNVDDADVEAGPIDVNVAGAQDAADNVQSPSPTTLDNNLFSINTNNPTVTSITASDNLISDSDAGTGTFYVTVTFSEAMKTTVTPTITFSPAASSLTFNSGLGGWSAGDTVYTAYYNVADDGIEAGPFDANVGGAQDSAGNAQSPDPTTLDNNLFSIDTKNPTVVSISVNDDLISDSDAADDDFKVTVVFSETMKTSAPVTISFSPDSSATLDSPVGAWSMTNVADDTYTATFNVQDADIEDGPIDVNAAGAQDASGNTQTPSPTTLDNDLFSIDTKNPTVAISVSGSQISEADVGSAVFSVTATFSESMDTSVPPTVGFDSSLCAASTLGSPSGSWSTTTYNDDTFTVTYDVTDNDDEGGDCNDIDVTVGDAQDLAGNAQETDPTTAADQFSIDTKQPVLSLPSSISTWSPTSTKVITFSATASDANIAGSPINIETTGCTPASGSTFGLGTTEVECSATDSFGNTGSGSFNVVLYQVSGFYQPVDMNGVYNKGKAGNTVPFKFNVYGGTGQITDISIVKAFKKAGATCPGASTPSDVIEEYVSATGGTTLRYDTTAQQFVYNGQSIKSDANKCFTVTLIIDDGTSSGLATISANVQYVK